jgi:hypothetical protein
VSFGSRSASRRGHPAAAADIALPSSAAVTGLGSNVREEEPHPRQGTGPDGGRDAAID